MAEASDDRVACPNCGKQYRWKPDLAGRKVVCKCGQKMRLPTTVSGEIEPLGPPPKPVDPNEGSTYDIEFNEEPAARADHATGSARSASAPSKCPSCNQPLKPGAVLCVNCGYNLESGKQLQTNIAEAPADEAANDAANETPAAASPLAALGGSSAVTRALEEREDEVQPSPIIEFYLPLGLIVLGLLMRFAQAMYFGDDAVDGFLDALIVTSMDLAISIPLLLLGLLVSVKLLSVSFGPLGQALFKLLAILLGPAALGDIVAYVVSGPLGSELAGSFAGFLVAVVTMWVLLSQLFDLEGSDAFYVLIIIYVVNFIVTMFVGIFVLGMMFA